MARLEVELLICRAHTVPPLMRPSTPWEGGRTQCMLKVAEAEGCGALGQRNWQRRMDAPELGRRAFEAKATAVGRARYPNVTHHCAYYPEPDEKLLPYYRLQRQALDSASPVSSPTLTRKGDVFTLGIMLLETVTVAQVDEERSS
uniref:Protein kinase domain-containing protein n=1 Tax=Oryza sativa subsp. japonica TaxID=39947 RepID=Q84MQ8_ORYSJ|nr:hypothetical protein [Oryza sativa Japonica Group]